MRNMLPVFLFCFTACTVGPEYNAPEINAPEQFVFQDVFKLLNKDKTEPGIGVNWWEGFGDPELSQLIEKAIENNQQIAGAAARVKAARANVTLVDANDALNSSLIVDSSVEERRILDDHSNNTDDSDFSASLGLSLPLDLFGRNKREVEAAIAALQASEAALRDVILGISTDVASEYLQYRGNQRQLELLKESVALQEKTLSIVKSRYEAGLSPELDLRRAETSVERLRSDIPPLQESLSNARHRLANFIGQYPGTKEVGLDNNKNIPGYQYKLLELMPADVLRQRPNIRQAEAELKFAIAQVGVAEADFYPLFNLFGEMQISSAGIIGGSALDIFSLTLAVLIEQFITDGGAREAQLEIAKARVEEALANYQQLLLDGAFSIETTLVALNSSLSRQRSLEKAVQSSERSFEQADRLYQLGLSSFLDVVDAQRVLASAEQQLATERTNYSTRIASLFRVLGTNVLSTECLSAEC